MRSALLTLVARNPACMLPCGVQTTAKGWAMYVADLQIDEDNEAEKAGNQ